MEDPSSYHLGAAWGGSPKRLGGDFNHELPWTDDYAERVFNGEIKQVRNFYQLAVLKGPLESPVAVASFQNAGHTVKVEFLDDEFRTVLTFLFVDQDLPDGMFLNPKGIQRPGDLLLRSVADTRWTGEPGTAGLERFETDRRQHSNLGTTRMLRHWVPDIERGPEAEWHVDPEVDVSGDGFWEPVATFGDWDRWFVKDRPGVKLFD